MSAGARRVGAVDGLRAVAVALVVLYHFFPASIPGGYLGVDVFFVLSGFLITSLLLREHARSGRVSLKAFWGRRVRRILPAALSVAGITATCALLADPDLRVGIGRQLLGICTFSTNWLQIASADSYFARNEPQLFLHYWSLAVEEQFYLLWPLLVVGCLALTSRAGARAQRAAVGQLAVAGATASALLMAHGYHPGEDPSRLYYGTDTHATGLLLGALAATLTTSLSPSRVAATWPTWRRSASRARRDHALAVVALFFIAVASFRMGDTDSLTYRGGLAAVSAATAVAVVAAARGDGRFSEWLAHPALRWVGLRSFSIYLVHWPVFVLVDALLVDPVQRASGLVPVLSITMTLLLGAASYRWIELPFLRRRVHLPRLPARTERSAGAAPGNGPTGGAARTARDPRLPLLRASAVAGLACVVTAASVAAVVTAPSTTSTQRALQDAQHEQELALLRPPPPPPPPPRPMPDGSHVTVVGDSVALGASQALMTAFPGMRSDAIDAQVSRSWLAVPSIVSSKVASGTVGEALVLGIGANGPAGAEYVRAVLDVVPTDVLVVVVNAYSTQAVLPSINAGITEACAGRANVEVADWYTAVSGHPDYLASDDVHPADERGRTLYAQVVRQALERLVARTPASPAPAATTTPGPTPDAGTDAATAGATGAATAVPPTETSTTTAAGG